MKAWKEEMSKKALWLTVGTAAGIGAIAGVREVMNKNKKLIAETEAVKKVSEFAEKVTTTGSQVAANVKEDLSTVVDSAKTRAAEVRKESADTKAPEETAPKAEETEPKSADDTATTEMKQVPVKEEVGVATEKVDIWAPSEIENKEDEREIPAAPARPSRPPRSATAKPRTASKSRTTAKPKEAKPDAGTPASDKKATE